MPDNVDALLRLSEEQHPDSKSHRRRVMAGIVQAMIDLAGGGGVRDEVHQHTAIMQLTAIISNMTDKVAEADDATFSAIVKETALLLCTLQRRQADMTGHATH
jgi:hypothetical protein